MYYLATPMFRTDVKHSEIDEARLQRNKEIAKVLEDNNIEIFLPQRDVDQNDPPKQVLEKEFEAIKECDGIIVVMSDTRGIYIEAGYAKALGKKVIGLKVEETREMSTWGYEFFDHVVSSTDELVSTIKNM